MRLVLILIVAFLGSCSSIPKSEPVKENEKFFGNIKFSPNMNSSSSVFTDPLYKENVSDYPINSLLWRSSIDLVSILPLETVDPKSGIISSNWFEIAENDKYRYKINIFFINPDLNAMSLKVTVLREQLNDNKWINDGFSTDLSLKIEDLILTRAKELRQLKD